MDLVYFVNNLHLFDYVTDPCQNSVRQYENPKYVQERRQGFGWMKRLLLYIVLYVSTTDGAITCAELCAT